MAYRPHITDARQVFSDDEIVGLMPKNFSFVAKLIGVEASLQLIDAYGGTSIFIPNKYALNIDHDISRVISLKKLQLLSEQLGNNSIEIPMGSPIFVAMRNRMVRDLAKKESKAKIARKFGVTQRTIRSIVNAEEKLKLNEDPNYDLFSN
ncbi:transcriptional regulator [Acinetobacter bereziniae]|uniref:Transcriptional regulator n=2 Tax=Acinetobacter bereziniae TaxID=106648 RepID=A0A8I1A9U1_ACIBZ|nr:Mor transcription activator family protein [Acinetobacter bereziniae]QQC83029.1 transcriptional regulator [Acinetobacter bereziniae]UUN96180.1 transcriptional regulator [Acinetobacter bereziniae]